MGLDDHDNQVYIIDFRLTRRYRDLKTHLHIPYKENCHPTGTSVATAIADVFRKNGINVGRKFAEIMKILDKIDDVKSQGVI